MDIQDTITEIKSRKGSSCSTLPSLIQSQDDQEIENHHQTFKHKKVRKDKKLRKYSSLNQESLPNLLDDPAEILVKQNKKIIFLMIREIFELFKLHIDTYLVCLKISSDLKFEGESFLCFEIAGSICLLVSKLYESDKISFSRIHAWCNGLISIESFEEIESTILYGLNFNLPSINSQWSHFQIQQEINKIESQFQ